MHYLDDRNRLVAAPEPRWIASPKRVRAVFAGVPVADSTRAHLFRGGGPPVYYFPREDVRLDLLAPSGSETDAIGARALSDVSVGERSAPGAAWEYTETAPDCDFLQGMVSLRWGAMDAWFEENEEVFVHARDPFKRIDTVASARRVAVDAGGVRVADSGSPVILIEPGHPVRYYLPKADVRMELLRPSEKTSRCPYKGQAVYYSLDIDGALVEDVAWSYHFTTTESAKIGGLVCFFDERVDRVVVDGEDAPKPQTAWRRA